MIDTILPAIGEFVAWVFVELFTCGGWRRDNKAAAAKPDADNGRDTAA